MNRPTKVDPDAFLIGQRIKQLREERGWSQQELWLESDVSKGHISSMEAGKANPTLKTLRALARALDVEIFDLYTFPEKGGRHMLHDRSRRLTRGNVDKYAREWDALPPRVGPKKPKPPRRRVTSSKKKPPPSRKI
jgi:transcriptional regulator with XRE-family HTH domain